MNCLKVVDGESIITGSRVSDIGQASVVEEGDLTPAKEA